jgi:hypothetical protein
MGAIGAAQEQRGGVDSSAGDHHDVSAISLSALTTIELDLDALDLGGGSVGRQPIYIGASEKRYVWQLEDGSNAVIVGVRLGLDEAGEAVAGIATDTLALPAHSFV